MEFGHYAGSGYACLNISSEANQNLSSAQKELLLWHWKLGISMQRVQELMRVIEVKEPNGAVSRMPRVITPKIKSAAYCPTCSASCVSFLGQSSESPRLHDLKLCLRQKAFCLVKSMRLGILCLWTSMWSKLLVVCLAGMDKS